MEENETINNVLKKYSQIENVIEEIFQNSLDIYNKEDISKIQKCNLNFLTLKRLHGDVKSEKTKITNEVVEYNKVLTKEKQKIHYLNMILSQKIFYAKKAKSYNFKNEDYLSKILKPGQDPKETFQFLENELKLRKQLKKDSKSLQKRKSELREKNDNLNYQIKNFDKRISNVTKASKDILNNKFVKETLKLHNNDEKNMSLLPSPLYTLYHKIINHEIIQNSRGVSETIKATIKGDTGAAKLYWKNDRNSNGISHKKKRKISKVNFDDDSEVFPLYIQVLFEIKGSKKIYKLLFDVKWIGDENIIVVNSAEDDCVEFLKNLFLYDSGLYSPIFHVNGIFDQYKHGRPYKWAQILCNLPVHNNNQIDENLMVDDVAEFFDGHSRMDEDMMKINLEFFLERVKFKFLCDAKLSDNIVLMKKRKIPKYSNVIAQRLELVKFEEIKRNEKYYGILSHLDHKDGHLIKFTMTISKYHPVVIPKFSLELIDSMDESDSNNGRKKKKKKSQSMREKVDVPEEWKSLVHKSSTDIMENNDDIKAVNKDLLSIENEVNNKVPDDLEDLKYVLENQLLDLLQMLLIFFEIEYNDSNKTKIVLGKNSDVENKFCNRKRKGKDRTIPIRYNEKRNVYE